MSRDVSRPRARIVAVSLALVLGASLIPLATVSAAVPTVAPADDTTMSADLSGSSNYDTLVGPAITENGAGALGTGTIVLTAPSGFQFQASAGSVAISGAACDMVVAFGSATTATVTASITTALTAATCVITFSGIKVQPTTGVLPNTGDITESGTASGAPGGSYGHLVMVAGAPVLTFTTSPSGSPQARLELRPAARRPRRGPVPQSPRRRLGRDRDGARRRRRRPVHDQPRDHRFRRRRHVHGLRHPGRPERPAPARLHPVELRRYSPAFDVLPGPANSLRFNQSPAANTAALLSPQPVVAVVNSLGNLVRDSHMVTLAINQFSSTFTCAGGLTVSTGGGLAEFSGCTQTTTGSGYTLTASSSGLPSVISSPFNVTSGVGGKLALCWGLTLPCVTTPPSPVGAGSPFSVQPVVRILDTAGNQVPTDNTTVVTIGIASGTPTSGGPGTLACASALSITVINGIGAYSGCRIDKLGKAYQIVATSSPALSSASSGPFDVVAGQPSKLAFVAQPASAAADAVFGTSPAVAIVDAGGNVVSSGISATIVLSIGTNPAGGTLSCSGGTSATTVNGVATFVGCKIDKQGSGYTLSATSTSSTPPLTLGTATSAPFDVVAPAGSIVLTASKSVITWGEKVTLHAHFGTNGAAKTFDVQAARAGEVFAAIATLTTNSSGDASFVYKPANNLYYRIVFAGSADLPAGVSSQVRVVVRQIALLRPTGKGHTRTVRVGTIVKFTTTIRPARPDLPKSASTWVVYQLVKGKWTKIITQHLSSPDGVTTLSLTFTIPGSFYIRSIADPTPLNANSVWSPVERYDVFPPS